MQKDRYSQQNNKKVTQRKIRDMICNYLASHVPCRIFLKEDKKPASKGISFSAIKGLASFLQNKTD